MVKSNRVWPWFLLFLYLMLFSLCLFAAIVNFGGNQAWIGWVLTAGATGIFATLAAINVWRGGPVVDALASIILYVCSAGVIGTDLVLEILRAKTSVDWSVVACIAMALAAVCFACWKQVRHGIGVLRTQRNLGRLFPGHDNGDDTADSHADGSDSMTPAIGAGDMHDSKQDGKSGIG